MKKLIDDPTTQDLSSGHGPRVPRHGSRHTGGRDRAARRHGRSGPRRAQLDTRHVAGAAGEHEAEIFDAHVLLLDDDELVGVALELIAHDSVGAEHAWRVAVDGLAARFARLTDSYLRSRADDIRAVGAQVLAHLHGHASGPSHTLAGILVTADLTPTQAARLDPTTVLGIVTAAGSPLSHGAILARALGIPAVVGAGRDVLTVPDGTTILVDGTEGVVVIDPDPAVNQHYRDKAAEQRQHTDNLLSAASRPAITSDGVSIEVVANIASRDDAVEAVRHGADGVGLLRTEFLFLDRPQPPGEDEQLEAYLSIAGALRGRRLTVRTLDVGGDKPVPYLPAVTEANPFLGRRGLRLSLQQPDIFKQQLAHWSEPGCSTPSPCSSPWSRPSTNSEPPVLSRRPPSRSGAPRRSAAGFEVAPWPKCPPSRSTPGLPFHSSTSSASAPTT